VGVEPALIVALQGWSGAAGAANASAVGVPSFLALQARGRFLLTLMLTLALILTLILTLIKCLNMKNIT
jgi:hypothetical protein